ncbi:MAG TPA: adenylosuccinate lyase [Pirellulales bacterium]|nr:adenylosuccinate lyase [Pirellulales bacterium]
MSHELYDNPLVTRYASHEMSTLWGGDRKFRTWRRMWIALAEAEKELGLPITDEQIAELKSQAENIDFEAAQQYEARLRHDVMAHVHAYGDVCPQARKIIHWGATSCFVTDNTDLILLRDAIDIIRIRLMAVIDRLATFAVRHRDLPCLGWTHLQPAQPTTVGKRAVVWAYDLILDLQELEHRRDQLRARSTKGTTGTQASFLKLFDGDHEKVRQLEKLVAEKIGFASTYAVTGQTYPRKIDAQVLDALAGVAGSAHKAATDLRLLQHRKEIDEPFEKEQIGSSAMAYKRNPMRSERICGLARYVISLQPNAANTLATQWMERTLDDSANRRIVLPQAFLATDALLLLYQNIADRLVVYPAVIRRNLAEELPFLASENILMAAVHAGGDRQELHERIRKHSQEAALAMKEQGSANDLLERLAGDEAFANLDLDTALDAGQLVGRAPEQVDEFVAELVEPLRAKYNKMPAPSESRVRL